MKTLDPMKDKPALFKSNVTLISSFLTLFIGLNLNGQTRYKDQVFSQITIKENLVYGHAKTQRGIAQNLTLDLYQPFNDDTFNRPLIIYAHGGHFMFGDKKEFISEAERLAKAGYVVASINYRLIDVEPSDSASMKAVIDAVHDMRAAVRYFYRDAKLENNYRIDPSRILVGGYSAGAVTALHYAYANSVEDVFEMGGEWLLDYVEKTGGFEGYSGNPGFKSTVKGVLNIAGSIHNASLVDKHEPFLVSIHGTADATVPFNEGVTGTTGVITQGSGLIHLRADAIGLKNLLIAMKNEDHSVRFSCEDCFTKVIDFLYLNL